MCHRLHADSPANSWGCSKSACDLHKRPFASFEVQNDLKRQYYMFQVGVILSSRVNVLEEEIFTDVGEEMCVNIPDMLQEHRIRKYCNSWWTSMRAGGRSHMTCAGTAEILQQHDIYSQHRLKLHVKLHGFQVTGANFQTQSNLVTEHFVHRSRFDINVIFQFLR